MDFNLPKSLSTPSVLSSVQQYYVQQDLSFWRLKEPGRKINTFKDNHMSVIKPPRVVSLSHFQIGACFWLLWQQEHAFEVSLDGSGMLTVAKKANT